MLAISADSGPTVSRRIRHCTGSRNLNVSNAVGTDISCWTSSGTGNSACRTVMLANMDACTYSDYVLIRVITILYEWIHY